MAPGENREITVRLDGVRSLDPASDGVTFSSANTNIATVSAAGIITAVASGETTITVAHGDSSATISVAIQ